MAPAIALTNIYGAISYVRWQVSYMDPDSASQYHHLLAIPTKERLHRVLTYMLDEEEFLSPYGIRSLSKFHKDHPFTLNLDGNNYCVQYIPGESNSYMFGGNSNWRGPIWVCSKSSALLSGIFFCLCRRVWEANAPASCVCVGEKYPIHSKKFQ